MSAEINYLSQQINNIKENLIEISHRLSKLEKYKNNYSSIKPANRFLKRDEIIEYLIRLDVPENKLTETTNYLQLLKTTLDSMNYKGILLLNNIQQFFKNIPEMNDDQKLIKTKILELVKQRQEDYNNRKKPIE
jgi:chromosome segregation ATPase